VQSSTTFRYWLIGWPVTITDTFAAVPHDAGPDIAMMDAETLHFAAEHVDA
jgi:hypothetical protein